MDYLFAWGFTLFLYIILPDAVLSKVQTVAALTVFAFTGLYIYSLIEHYVTKNHSKKNRKVINIKHKKVS